MKPFLIETSSFIIFSIILINLLLFTNLKINHFQIVFSDEPTRAVEPLRPPPGSAAGERISVEGYESGNPDEVLNPKKKVWEKLQADLVVNGNGEASWSGNPLLTSSSGKVTADSLKNVPIK